MLEHFVRELFARGELPSKELPANEEDANIFI